MGQKTNPIILRVGKFLEWDSKYIEKKSLELPKQTLNDITIKSFLIKLLKDNGIRSEKLIVNQSENSLHIFINYYLSFNSAFEKNVAKKKVKFLPKERKKKIPKRRKKKVKRLFNYYKLKNNLKSSKYIKNIYKSELHKLKIRRVLKMKVVNATHIIRKYRVYNSIKLNSFMNKLLVHLKMFAVNTKNIYVIFRQLNPSVRKLVRKKQVKTIKNIILKLRKYKRSLFYKEGLNVMLSTTQNKSSTNLLANFIAEQLKTQKRHNFFLRFIKSGLTLFLNKRLSFLRGIKIRVKGRLNGRPRARQRMIKIKKGVSAQTFQSKLDYSEATSFTKNGTIGVKVWLQRKGVNKDYVK